VEPETENDADRKPLSVTGFDLSLRLQRRPSDDDKGFPKCGSVRGAIIRIAQSSADDSEFLL
jgi:hypothetical protein